MRANQDMDAQLPALRDRQQLRIETAMGPLYLAASERGLSGVYWTQQASVPLARTDRQESHQTDIIRNLTQATKELQDYLMARRTTFTVPLDVHGTTFQKAVWAELSRLPYGKTCSYKDIAIRLGNEKSVRAVGMANGKNPLCIVLPCHRVIASDGSLGGYSGGLSIKTRLLALEQTHSTR